MEEYEYRVLLEGGEAELVEKKSRFLASVQKCESEKEAVSFIEERKKKYWDASHNCSAFVLGSRAEITRCSDDREPGGTAGRPMLEVLLGEKLRNVVVVVTRYFGGTLLGTGGLVRAYTQAVKEGLSHCRIGRMRPGLELEITTDYNSVGRILTLLARRGMEPADSLYTDTVMLRLTVPANLEQILCAEIVEAANGKVKCKKVRECYMIEKEEPGSICEKNGTKNR